MELKNRLYQVFIDERRYLKGVSPKTAIWYECAFVCYEKYGPGVKKFVKNAQIAGVSAISINSYRTALNAYFKWAYNEGHVKEVLNIPILICEQKILATLTPQHVNRLIAFRPQTRGERRIHIYMLLLLDTGLRLNEGRHLQKSDVDFDNLLLTVKGKGGKHRVVPISIELRKILYRFLQNHPHPFLFTTSRGTLISERNILRDFKKLCAKIHITGV